MLSMSALTTLTLPAIASGRFRSARSAIIASTERCLAPAAELLEDRVQLLRLGSADVIHQSADDVEERRGLELDALRAPRRRLLERLHQLLELAPDPR